APGDRPGDRPHPAGGRPGPRRGRPVAGTVARRLAVRPRTARRRRSAQRRGRLPLLDGRGDRRRPGPAPAPLPRGHRELAARPEHRDRGADGERVPGRSGAHRRQEALEPARGDGHRPVPARAAPFRHRRPGRLGAGRGAATAGRRQPAGGTAAGERRAAPGLRPPLRPGGQRSLRRGAGLGRRGAVHRPVRLHPVDQRRRRGRHRHARLGEAPCFVTLRV
ncbi:MAG: putative RNA methyltransferase, partial [uncultured Blastococcus sp.]